PGMHERQAVALELLQDEAFAAEETGAKTLGEADADAGAVRRAEEGVLLADEPATDLAQFDGHHGARIGRGEGDAGLALAGVAEVGHEQRLARQQPLAYAPQLAQYAAGRAVAHARFEAHAVGHVVHRAGFGDHRFAGVEDDFHRLRGRAENFVIEFMAGHRRRSLFLMMADRSLSTGPRAARRYRLLTP